ncbi:Peptidase S8/S53 subtilisin/kexin/sedolisin [Lasiodiplodia theobromae]|uniref:Peptidase S8/S53 subtilisin/kexin/sedolisin n=1 Tax=Lasiodiplodia theobromae TaxID=45133 RepID=UPI0015C3D264|nr:Peptidase S8/S53 subtilisin/kexin/sedolisin [Lasiodiplodia theobromae]KAF4534441.1 Peptidase S8/S53 subtilisin/kexin/sedolisin [Lasiodiplodia theobromae]
MRACFIFTLLFLAALSVSQVLGPRYYDLYDYYALQIDTNVRPLDVATELGFDYEGPFPSMEGYHLFRSRKQETDVVEDIMKARKFKREAHALGSLDGVKFSQKQVAPKSAARKRQDEIIETLDIHDPLFTAQWHLLNTREDGNDINVTGLWKEGITGKGSTVCIVDDGLDLDSDDLKDNYFRAGSYDFNDHVQDPKPRLLDDTHGTRCAGEVAAARNSACGVGVAYDARISGIRILSGDISDADAALAMNYAMDQNQIYSCSWGPLDNGASMGAPSTLVQRALINGVQKGRQGRGAIYVFATGNGAAKGDNCNFDGYANTIYSITIGAISRTGLHPSYSERCSAQLAVTYSSDGPYDAIFTTDVGSSKCTNSHGGTSAAAPLAAAIYALALQVRPELTWRDMQWLTVLTAIPFEQKPLQQPDLIDSSEGWQDTPYGKRFSHQFGYGKLDAYAFVQAAKTWQVVKPQAWYFAPCIQVNQPIPQGEDGLNSSIEVTEVDLNGANLERIEHVTITINVNHSRRGDLSVVLRSPSGIISQLSTSRPKDNAHEGYSEWMFMSVAHWGENGIGSWTISVKDGNLNEHEGVFTDWKLHLWGESIDPSQKYSFPLPGADDTGEENDTVVPSPSSSVGSEPTQDPSADHDPPAAIAVLSQYSTMFWIYSAFAISVVCCCIVAFRLDSFGIRLCKHSFSIGFCERNIGSQFHKDFHRNHSHKHNQFDKFNEPRKRIPIHHRRKDGYCGTGDDYCSKPDCQEDYGKCQSNDGTLGFPHCSWADSGTSPRCDGKCGSAFNNAICDTSAKADAFAIYGVYNYGGCCSSGGFCGSTSDHCQQGCQSGCDEGYGPAAASSSAAAAATSASAAEQLDMPPSGFMIAFFSVLGMVLGL